VNKCAETVAKFQTNYKVSIKFPQNRVVVLSGPST
jgi:hypothetical protein